jgi:hypothetical protein
MGANGTAPRFDVTVGGELCDVGPFNLEKTLRVLDALNALAAASSTAEDVISEWIAGEVDRIRRQRQGATEVELERERQAHRAALEAANPLQDGMEPETRAAMIEAHVERLMTAATPPMARRVIRMLPYVYREARGELVSLLTLAVVPAVELEQADVEGRADAFLVEQARHLRHHATLAETVAIVETLGRRIRDEVTDDALGEAVASLQEAIESLSSAVTGWRTPAPGGSSSSTPGPASRSSTASP